MRCDTWTTALVAVGALVLALAGRVEGEWAVGVALAATGACAARRVRRRRRRVT